MRHKYSDDEYIYKMTFNGRWLHC